MQHPDTVWSALAGVILDSVSSLSYGVCRQMLKSRSRLLQFPVSFVQGRRPHTRPQGWCHLAAEPEQETTSFWMESNAKMYVSPRVNVLPTRSSSYLRSFLEFTAMLISSSGARPTFRLVLLLLHKFRNLVPFLIPSSRRTVIVILIFDAISTKGRCFHSQLARTGLYSPAKSHVWCWMN